jgi:hypothetical protein
MNGVADKTLAVGSMDREVMRIICKCGFIARESNGQSWVTTGEAISVERFNRLLALELIEPKGDSLFGGPSQTYVPTQKGTAHAKRCKSLAYSDQAD